MGNHYFNDLNYSLGNEDTKVEYQMVKRLKPSVILSVCGSGSRALPLLAANPTKLICVDLATQQLDLLALRIGLIKNLVHEEFLKFFGYAPFEASSTQMIDRKGILLQMGLPQESENYFLSLFEKKSWETILYDGKWEKTFYLFSRFVYKILGDRRDELFQFTSLDEQRAYVKQSFPRWRWLFILFVLGNRSVFNALLYGGHFVKKNIPEGYFTFYRKSFDYLFNEILARENFFLQLCFLGKIHFPEGNMLEAESLCFEEMKKNLLNKTTEIIPIKGDLIDTISSSHDIDFISLSDVPSYFSGDMERSFLQRIRPGLKKGAILVIRNYLRIPECDKRGFRDVTKDYQDLIAKEKVQVYKFSILRFEP